MSAAAERDRVGDAALGVGRGGRGPDDLVGQIARDAPDHLLVLGRVEVEERLRLGRRCTGPGRPTPSSWRRRDRRRSVP
uniref:Uncharacterized protein n=1 Tax=Janibacter limosus TaxID=53458 RepID=A0AC61U2Z4_9MICO|nr:hypothetical protein [Janibacter limosus]